jgi:hypothetical protein
MNTGKPINAFALIWGMLALVGGQSLAYADMRCGTALVTQGNSTYEVQSKCGPPAHREVIPAAPDLG